MREIKSKYRAFEKIQVDIKYLDDIPEFIMISCNSTYQNTK